MKYECGVTNDLQNMLLYKLFYYVEPSNAMFSFKKFSECWDHCGFHNSNKYL